MMKKAIHLTALSTFIISITLYISNSYKSYQQEIANQLEKELLDNRINSFRETILANPFLIKALADSEVFYDDKEILEITKNNKANVKTVEFEGARYQNKSDTLYSALCRQMEAVFNRDRTDSIHFLP